VILHYYKSTAGNFGDDINLWLWDRLLPGCWNEQDGIRFAGIGTIITQTMPPARSWIVLGSGAGYGPPPEGFGGPGWSIMSVRGPLSAHVLHLPADKVVTDGALLVNQLPEYQPLPESERTGIVFVPHHQALEAGAWPEVCRRAGVNYIDPRNESKAVIDSLRRARLVIADSMHAAIIADAVRVPWVPVATSLEINTFKWIDWTQSMDVPYEPIRLPASTVAESIRSATLRLHGQRYFVTPPSIGAVIKHYDRAASLKRKQWWPYVQRAGERLYASGVSRTARGLHRNRLLQAFHDARLDSAAKALQQVARRESFLSPDRIWQRRTEQLSEQVARLRTFLA
jgi:succinoglycan biosynthesis protein ExoV